MKRSNTNQSFHLAANIYSPPRAKWLSFSAWRASSVLAPAEGPADQRKMTLIINSLVPLVPRGFYSGSTSSVKPYPSTFYSDIIHKSLCIKAAELAAN